MNKLSAYNSFFTGAWIFCIYDNRHRLVLSQDGNQRYGASPPEWSYTIYDHLDRPTEQGVWSSTSTRASLVSYIGLNAGYLVGRSERIPLKYLHYNDYADCPAANSINAADTSALGVRQCTDNTGRLTWERTRMLNLESGITEWLVSAFYYDIYGRVIQTVSDNHLGGKEYITHKYNFSGQALQTRHRHMTGGSTIWTDLYHDYDHRGRVVKTRYQIDGASEVLMAGYSYDQTGAQRTCYLHSESGGPFLQRNNYSYNIRGWLTQINNPSTFTENSKFGLKLYYKGGPWPCPTFYNGNIAGMLWGTPTHSSMYYVYSYDGNNRMTNANFNRSGMSPTALDVHYTYDLNGNIKTLDRYGFQGTYIDRLTFTYSGNQVIGLSDASGDVAQVTDYPGSSSPMALNYDDNGNVDVETHKLIETTYNLLNLPFELNWLGQNRRINYYYTFEGEKLRKRVENNRILTKEDYCGPFVYETASGVRSLKYIVTPKGRAVRNGSNWSYEYHLADHLGNVRAVIRKGANGMAELIQQRHYYPFGMEISNMSSGTGTNKYLYNGKEIQNDFDLYWYDYGARFYDPQIGRWHSIDPLTEERSFISPYNFVQNNPISRFDPNGALDAPIYDRDANFLGTDDQGLQGKAIVMDKDKFKQGMSHEAALSNSLGAEGLSSDAAGSKLLAHYDNLKTRLDYDGVVTIGEGVDWAKQHPNTLPNNITADNSLYLDASKLNFGDLSVKNIGLQEGQKGNVHLLDYVKLNGSSFSTTYALGNTQMQLLNAKSGNVKLFWDDYNWDYHNYPQALRDAGKLPANTRDRLIYFERQRTGLNDSHGFRVFIYGTGTIKTK